MTSALPDGRVPMDMLLDEKDDEFLAEWDAADADALAATRALLDRVGDRPLPSGELRRASARLRQDIVRPGWPGRLLIECSGLRPDELPDDDAELWLRLAAGVASPQGSGEWGGPDTDDGESPETESELTAICAIDHFDWLAAITALAEGGPGTAASAVDLAAYVRDYDPEEPDDGTLGEPAGENDENDENEPGDFFLSEDDDPICYIGELGPYYAFNRHAPNLGPRISITTKEGRLLGRLAGNPPDGNKPGQFLSTHSVALDSHGDMYVGQVGMNSWPQLFPGQPIPEDLCHIRKLVRVK